MRCDGGVHAHGRGQSIDAAAPAASIFLLTFTFAERHDQAVLQNWDCPESAVETHAADEPLNVGTSFGCTSVRSLTNVHMHTVVITRLMEIKFDGVQ